MPWTTSDRMMELRSQHPAIEVLIDTLDGWRRHITGRNASVLAFFGFLSIFPLLLAATTVLGLLLENNEDLRQRIIDGALDDLPVLGQQLANDPASLNGSFFVLAFGITAALWSATKAFVALQGAQDDTWEVHVDHRDAMPRQRGKALLGILFIGLAQAGTIAISSLVNNAGLPAGSRILLVVGSFAVNLAVMIGMFRFLTSARVTVRDIWAGAITAAVCYSLLHHFGTAVVQRVIANASDTYGQFALVLGLVTWLSLLSIATLMSVEFNAALVRYHEGSLDRVDPADDDMSLAAADQIQPSVART